MSQWIGLVTEYEEHGRGLAKSDLKFGDKNHVFVPGREMSQKQDYLYNWKV